MLTWRDMSKSIKLLEMISTQDSSRYCIVMYDGNGNITDYVDANGTNVAHYEYGPFGGITASSGRKNDDFTHRFSTKPYDADTGLIRYQLRDYSAELGRWVSRDPIGVTGGLGLYKFCRNSPPSRYDNIGLLDFIFTFGVDQESLVEASALCGHFEYIRVWRLGKRQQGVFDFADNGAVVQHVTINVDWVKGPPLYTAEKKSDKWDYWEAWRTERGVYKPPPMPLNQTGIWGYPIRRLPPVAQFRDIMRYPNRGKCTTGKGTFTGEAWYIDNYVLDKWEQNADNGQEGPWGFAHHSVDKPIMPDKPSSQVVKTEEKGSDVNLATHLLCDGYENAYECAVIVSNDSDLAEPVRIVAEKLGKMVGILNPHKHPSKELSKYARFLKQVRKGVLSASQFPPVLKDAHGEIHKPEPW